MNTKEPNILRLHNDQNFITCSTCSISFHRKNPIPAGHFKARAHFRGILQEQFYPVTCRSINQSLSETHIDFLLALFEFCQMAACPVHRFFPLSSPNTISGDAGRELIRKRCLQRYLRATERILLCYCPADHIYQLKVT